MTAIDAGAIRARDLAFAYAGRAEPAFRDVSIDVEPGECLLVVGPSGSGKSTLALAIAGLIPREVPGELRGHLSVGGLATAAVDHAAIAALVGVVFQDPGAQLVMDRVEDDVAFGLENRGWARPAMFARVPAAIAEVGLAGLERRRPSSLSGGQQQRLALAGAMAPRPGILVLDEPTANLDPVGTAAFFERLAALRAGRRTTIVLIEHRVERAWPLADRVLAFGLDGLPIDFGAPGEVLRRSGRAMAAAGIWLPGDRTGAIDAAAATAASVGIDANGAIDGGAALVEATDLVFGYERGSPVLRGVDVRLGAGEWVALVGPNGSGKSTLGRLLVGLLRPSGGRVLLGGRDPARLRASELAGLAGYVFQDPEQQFLASTVAGEVRLGLAADRWATAEALMVELGLPLERFGERSPYRLSGGEKRRLSLASVLVRRPRLLVLDEPTFGQDRRGYEALVAILRERVAGGTCVVAATHDERLVADVARRRIELAGGRIVADGPIPAPAAEPEPAPAAVPAPDPAVAR